MREFIPKYLAQESLAKKGMDERIENYRKLHERYGKLALASVVKEASGELTVKLMASDASVHEFIFTVQHDPPHKLVSVGIREWTHSHFGFEGFHH